MAINWKEKWVVERAERIIKIDENHDRLIECMMDRCEACDMLAELGVPKQKDGRRIDGDEQAVASLAMQLAEDAAAKIESEATNGEG